LRTLFSGSTFSAAGGKGGVSRALDLVSFEGQGAVVPGDAATVLGPKLDPNKNLASLTVRPLANDVVIGLMAVTLAR